MNVQFNFKNFDPSEHIQAYARRRFVKLGRFFGKNKDIDISVNMGVDKLQHRVDVRLSGNAISITADEQTHDMYTSIDLVSDKLEAQVKKMLSRAKESRRKARNDAHIDVFSYEVTPPEVQQTITGRDHFSPKPMSPEEAAMQLATDNRSFIVFLNSENERINVLYRRKTQDFGLIDPVI